MTIKVNDYVEVKLSKFKSPVWEDYQNKCYDSKNGVATFKVLVIDVIYQRRKGYILEVPYLNGGYLANKNLDGFTFSKDFDPSILKDKYIYFVPEKYVTLVSITQHRSKSRCKICSNL